MEREIYQVDILTNVVEPLNKLCSQIDQQDSAPAHKTKTMQQWLENHVPEFISSDHWPSAIPDLNPFDYIFWSVLENVTCTRHRHSLELLKQPLVQAVDNFPIDVVHTAIDE